MEKRELYTRPECVPAILDEELALCLTGSAANQDYDETDYVWEG